MWSVLIFALWGLSQVTLAQDDGEVSATVPPLSRLLEDIDGDFIDSLVNVADSLIDQVFPTGDVSTTSTSSSSTTTAEPSTTISSIVTATSPIQSETAAADCCDDDDDDDNLGIILGSVFGALALIGLALLIFFCCRKRKSKKRKARDVAEIEKNPADSEAFLAGSPTAAHTTDTTVNAPNVYTGTTMVPPPPSSAWGAAADQRRQSGSSSPTHERRQSTQPLIAPHSMTATGEPLKRGPGGRPVVHPGIGELPADVESQPLRESTPSANGAASELSSDKAHDGRPSSGGLPMNTNTNTVSSIANTDATNDGSIPSTLDNPSSRPPWVASNGIAAAAESRHGPTKGLGPGPGPYDSDVAFRDQLSRSPPPVAKVPAQFNPYAFDENIYENPTDVPGYNTQIQPSSRPMASGNYFDSFPSNKHHESYNSSSGSSGVGITNANIHDKHKAAGEHNKYTNASDGDFYDTSSSTLYSDNRDLRNQPQSRSYPHPPSVITSSLPQHKRSADGFGEVSPLVSPPVRNPLRPHSGQYHGASSGKGDATDFDFGFAGGSGNKPAPAGIR